MTTNDKRKKPESERRRAINCLVHPDTLRLLKPLAAHLKLSQGQVLDRAVAALAVAESFGPQYLNLDEPKHHIRIAPTSAACGADLSVFEWVFVDYDHASAAVRENTRLQPCAKCMESGNT